MANISRELNLIRIGRWGEEIRMPIHDALKKMADETPSGDPSGLDKFSYMIAAEGEYVIASEGDLIVASEPNWLYIVTSEGDFVASSEENYIIGLE